MKTKHLKIKHFETFPSKHPFLKCEPLLHLAANAVEYFLHLATALYIAPNTP